MRQKKKICLVIPTFVGGGMERVMSELANYFNSKGHEIHILFLVRHKPFYKIEEGIKYYFPKGIYKKDTSFRPFYWIGILGYLRKQIKKINPDVVFSIPQDYSNLSIIALIGTGIPVYISDRNSPNLKISFVMNIFRKICYPFAKGIIAQTSYAKQVMLERGIKNKNIIVIPNPIKNISNYPKDLSTKKVILNIGRLVFEKNQKELIDIFSEINDSNWELHIIGDGPLKRELNEQILSLGMQNYIKILKPVANVDIAMAQSEIFAFTSIYEGFPNEAMAYPLACISYNCIAGPSDIIENGVNGILVDIKDHQEYINKLKKLMNSAALRENLTESSVLNREKFSLEKIGERYLDFFSKS